MTKTRQKAEKAAALVIAARFIARFEGGQARDGKFHPYWDSAGRVWTQGFGHTVGVSAHSKPWSKTKATAVLAADLNRVYAPAIDRVGVPLKRYYYAAVLSFVYNLGVGMLDRSHDFGRLLHKRQLHAAAESLLEYDRAGGAQLAGLTRRRRAERALALRSFR